MPWCWLVRLYLLSVYNIFLDPRRRNAALLWRDSGGSECHLFIMLCSVMLPILSTPRLFTCSLLRAMSTSEFKQAPHKYVHSTIAHYRAEHISQTTSVSQWMPDDVNGI
jgi:hypothetical protein